MAANAFTDGNGSEWKLRLTVGLVADVKREVGVDLGAITKSDSAWVNFLFGDSEKFVSMLWVMCESQAKERGVSPEQFAHLFDGVTLEAAGTALAGAIADFFPRSRVAKAIREGLGKILTATDERMVAAIGALKIETSSDSATSSPASSGSTPAG